MDDITIDGVNEHKFRLSIENMLRHGKADDAARKLRGLIAPYAGDGAILPARFLTVTSADISLAGWEELGKRIAGYDRPNNRISAFSIAVTDPEAENAPAAEPGVSVPRIETNYFSDDAYPFSEADRGDLLDGYSLYGCEWQGDFEKTDSTLSVKGVDDLYGFISRLEARLMDSKTPNLEEIRAGSLGACYLAVLLHQAVRDKIAKDGLPRALCVMAGNDGVYPFFDAPVISSEECVENGSAERAPPPEAATPPSSLASLTSMTAAEPETEVEIDEDFGDPINHKPAFDPSIPAYESLLNMRGGKARKKPVIMLDAEASEFAAQEQEEIAAQHLAEAETGHRSLRTAGISLAGATANIPTFSDFDDDDEDFAPLPPLNLRRDPPQAPEPRAAPPVLAQPEAAPIPEAPPRPPRLEDLVPANDAADLAPAARAAAPTAADDWDAEEEGDDDDSLDWIDARQLMGSHPAAGGDARQVGQIPAPQAYAAPTIERAMAIAEAPPPDAPHPGAASLAPDEVDAVEAALAAPAAAEPPAARHSIRARIAQPPQSAAESASPGLFAGLMRWLRSLGGG